MGSLNSNVPLKLLLALCAMTLLFLAPAGISWLHACYASALYVCAKKSTEGRIRRMNGIFIAVVIVMGAFLRGVSVWNFSIALDTAVRGLLALATLMLLAENLTFAEFAAWIRKYGASSELVGTMLLLLRYGGLLKEESYRLERAALARSFSNDAKSSWKTKSSLLGALFIRATARAERIYRAMLAREFR